MYSIYPSSLHAWFRQIQPSGKNRKDYLCCTLWKFVALIQASISRLYQPKWYLNYGWLGPWSWGSNPDSQMYHDIILLRLVNKTKRTFSQKEAGRDIFLLTFTSCFWSSHNCVYPSGYFLAFPMVYDMPIPPPPTWGWCCFRAPCIPLDLNFPRKWRDVIAPLKYSATHVTRHWHFKTMKLNVTMGIQGCMTTRMMADASIFKKLCKDPKFSPSMI